MAIIYMQSTIDNFIKKGRINEIKGDAQSMELKDEEGKIITKYYKFEKNKGI